MVCGWGVRSAAMKSWAIVLTTGDLKKTASASRSMIVHPPYLPFCLPKNPKFSPSSSVSPRHECQMADRLSEMLPVIAKDSGMSEATAVFWLGFVCRYAQGIPVSRPLNSSCRTKAWQHAEFLQGCERISTRSRANIRPSRRHL